MLCPQCGWIRNKKAWRPSQWKAESAVTDDYRQCKVCDGELDHEQTWYRRPGASTPQSQTGAQSRAPHPHPWPAPGEFLEDAYVLQNWASGIDSSTFGEFVHQWMKLNKKVRKTLSHNGAVKSRHGDPCHYRCPVENVKYFDPITKIYSVALSILAPQLESETDWNMEKRGDICESLMGWAYLVKMRVKGREENVETTKGVADIIDCFSWRTYRLEATAGDDFFHWVRWIKDNAACRQFAQATKEEQEAAHQSLVRVCEQPDPETRGPRCKSGGLLPFTEIPDVSA